MTIAQQLTDIAAAKEATRTAIVGKGGTLPAGSGLTAFPAAVGAIPSGGGGVGVTGFVDGSATVIDWSSAGDTGSIRGYAFFGCSALTTLILPSGITGSIGLYAFYGCSALKSLALPPGITGSIGIYAFYGCSALTSLTLPPGITGSIGTNAFRSCSALTTLTLPPGITGSIGSSAFRSCSALTTLTLPPGMTGNIGTDAFNGCTSLTSLVIQSPTMMTLANVSAFSGTTCNIYVPDSLVATYKAATNWSTFAARIKPISELP